MSSSMSAISSFSFSNAASARFVPNTTTSARMKRWGTIPPRCTITPRASRCRRACHHSSIPVMRKSASSPRMAVSHGRVRHYFSRRPWPANTSRSKKSTRDCGPFALPTSCWGDTTHGVAGSTRWLRWSTWGAPPAPLAPRLHKEKRRDQKVRSTVTHVAGLICYPCPRPFALPTPNLRLHTPHLRTSAPPHRYRVGVARVSVSA